jgi:UDPglucose 6-dehydrogenase
MNVTVIGTGYVGLVSGACLAELGHQVTCVDSDQGKLDRLKQGVMPIFEPGLEEFVKRNYEIGRLQFTSSYAEAIPGAEVISIAVGTPSADDGSVDLSYVESAARSIGEHLNGYAVIADKSTVPVGTAERVARIIREVYAGEFAVVSNPEFLREGHAVKDFMDPSRIVIGADDSKAEEVIQRMYSFIDCQKISMCVRSAELTKYAANAFLATKISFINEMAHLANEFGADIEEIAKGIGTDPRIGKEFLRAGLGWGGSCFPKDVRAILWAAKSKDHPMPVVQAASEMNHRAKDWVVEQLEKKLGGLAGKKIGVLGISFKNNTDDTRESAALHLIGVLHGKGATVIAYDPEAVIYEEAKKSWMRRVEDVYEAVREADAVLIATEWDEFRMIDPAKMKELMKGTLIFDGRNLLDPSRIRATGFEYIGVGRGTV